METDIFQAVDSLTLRWSSMAFKLPNLTDKPSISKSSSVKAEYANNEEIRATDCFSFPPNGLKLLLYTWA